MYVQIPFFVVSQLVKKERQGIIMSTQQTVMSVAVADGGNGADAMKPHKLFVLDTNILMHDPMSLYRFEEHDVYVPMTTQEELDNHKSGHAEIARNSREASRMLEAIIQSNGENISGGIDLMGPSRGDASGRLFFQTDAVSGNLPLGLMVHKPDNQILLVVQQLQQQYSTRQVVLVSKDINLRIKARALGLMAQDYKNDQVIEDTNLLPGGSLALPPDFWDSGLCVCANAEVKGSRRIYTLSKSSYPQLTLNQFVYWEAAGQTPFYAIVRSVEGGVIRLETLTDRTHAKNNVWGITARNREQNFALNLLMDPDIDFITLLGQAGTGKTLLTLAAGLEQVMEKKRYGEIIMTRVTVPVGEDIGFLPGTEEEKMGPWMGALEDNLEVLNEQGDRATNDWGRAATRDLVRNRIKIKSLNFMRGRTFLNKFLIIDEAQNLTPKQMKTLITRAGPGTKVVCLGNIAQIDTPYLTEGSSGLTYVVDRFRGWVHAGHITLQRGERSRLADYAIEVL